MEFHPVANLFPLMTDKEFDELKIDIEQNGLIQPILVADGKIADGRNRYNACVALGIKPEIIEWDKKGSLIDRVVSLNLNRRHLDSSQKAVVALNIEQYLSIEAKERQREAVIESNKQRAENPYPQIIAELTKNRDNESAVRAAKMVGGTNKQYVKDAKSITKKAPEVIDVILAGKIKIPDAKEVAKLPEEERKEVIKNISKGENPKHAINKIKVNTKKQGRQWSDSETERMNIVLAGGVVFANNWGDVNLVDWARTKDIFLDISSTSVFRNPFVSPEDGSEEETLEHFRQYLKWKPSLTKRLKNLSQIVIGCRCLTERCHCDVVKEFITTK